MMKICVFLLLCIALSFCSVLPSDVEPASLTIKPFCPTGYVYTSEVGCIKSCSNPDYKTCGNIFPLIYNPSYCALGKNGKWVNFTFDCQACGPSNTQYVGVVNGSCDSNGKPRKNGCSSDANCKAGEACQGGVCVNKCAFILCKIGETCVNGQCVPQDPVCPSCPQGTVCKKGRCVPDIQVCPVGSSYNATVCTDPRPTDKTCPVIYYIRAPDPLYCGVRADGSRVDFPRECETCKDKGIVYYFDVPCAKAPVVCKDGYDCVGNRCVTTCKKLCPINYTCINDSCVPTQRYCKTASDCQKDEKCSNGICVDICSGVFCPTIMICQGGKCVNSCIDVLCPKGTTCQNGKCIPNTNISVCPVGSSYNATVCTDPRPTEKTCPTIVYIRAPDPLYCGVRADGTRVDFPRECETCKDKGIVYYFDVPCSKAPLVCKNGENCIGNYCSTSCTTTSGCPYNWQICASGQCIDKCATIRCLAGYRCYHGQCIPNTVINPSNPAY